MTPTGNQDRFGLLLQWLRENGVSIVRIWDARGNLKEVADIIKRNFDIVEEYRQKESGAVVLAFRRQVTRSN